MCDYCAWIEKILRPPTLEALPTVCTNIVQEEPKKPVNYDRTILVHGTADSISSREEINKILRRIEIAAIEAYRELAKGCSSVDAVEIAIRKLENSETNTLLSENVDTSNGNDSSAIRDAAIMDSDANIGSVGAVTGNSHPITLARKVMENTDHVLIVESGVDSLATSSENDFSEKMELVASPSANAISESSEKCIKLCGAVARDRKGRLTCGVSTIDKCEENIAKSSMTAAGTVLGCGIFADAESCCTVSGEDRAIYVHALARKIIERLERERAKRSSGNDQADEHYLEALNDELVNFIKDTDQSCVGVATLSLQGQPEVAFKSLYFPWAYCSKGVVTSGCIQDEIFTKDVDGLDMPLDCECP